MKFLTALLLAFPLSSIAAHYANCDLYAFTFSATTKEHYKLIDSARISHKWRPLNQANVTLKDSVNPLSYTVSFSLDGGIQGELNGPGIKVKNAVAISELLELEMEEVFRGGKVLYKLHCSID